MMVHDTQPGISNSMAFDIFCKSSDANWNFAVTPTNAAAHVRGSGYTRPEYIPNAWYENSYVPNSAWGIPTGDAVFRMWADLLKSEGALGVWMKGHKYNLYRIGPSFAGLCTCEAGKAFSASGNAPCTTCKGVTACSQGVKTPCTTTADTVCNVPCEVGKTFSASGNAPCISCGDEAACVHGTKTPCTTTTDTVCNVSPPHPITGTVVSVVAWMRGFVYTYVILTQWRLSFLPLHYRIPTVSDTGTNRPDRRRRNRALGWQ